MIRRRTAALLALLTTLALSASAQAAHNHKRKQAACRNPTALSFSRQNGRRYGTLSWKPGRGTPRRTRYRVLRSGRVIGQTRRHWMRVHHDVWYTDSTTEANRISLAKSSGLGGVGLWRLGREDQRLWSDPLLGSAW
jgi:hypothetical protein